MVSKAFPKPRLNGFAGYGTYGTRVLSGLDRKIGLTLTACMRSFDAN